MRLAYQELQIDRKKEEKKLQSLEGPKREQAERLGMGLVSRRWGFLGETGVCRQGLQVGDWKQFSRQEYHSTGSGARAPLTSVSCSCQMEGSWAIAQILSRISMW